VDTERVFCNCCHGEYLFHVDNAGRRYVILLEADRSAIVRYLKPTENQCPCRPRLWGLLRAHLGGCHRQRAAQRDGRDDA
jgi:hypothetical protein